jgi:peptidyl-prolyl cis-trans isomerase SurA
LDKIAGVINEKTYTISEINRFKKTIPARIEISPINYPQKKYKNKDIFELLKQTYVIKSHLNNAGFVINDDAVESRIKQTEQRLRLTRKDLINFLSSKNITFNEYFEVIREAMEYTIFNQRIISPLVTITDQEIKNFYYKTASNKKALSFKYEIVDFVYSKAFGKRDLAALPLALKQYQETGTIERKFKDFDTNNLGSVLGDDLPRDINNALKKTDEGSFSNLLLKIA